MSANQPNSISPLSPHPVGPPSPATPQLRLRSSRYRQASTELGYFCNNRDKMACAQYHALGLIISSGPVEAAAKTIVGHRLRRSGMRWMRQGGQHILNLRVLVQSNRWDPFWNWYLEQTTPQQL